VAAVVEEEEEVEDEGDVVIPNCESSIESSSIPSSIPSSPVAAAAAAAAAAGVVVVTIVAASTSRTPNWSRESTTLNPRPDWSIQLSNFLLAATPRCSTDPVPPDFILTAHRPTVRDPDTTPSSSTSSSSSTTWILRDSIFSNWEGEKKKRYKGTNQSSLVSSGLLSSLASCILSPWPFVSCHFYSSIMTGLQ